MGQRSCCSLWPSATSTSRQNFAREHKEHNIPGSNAGQIAKEFAPPINWTPAMKAIASLWGWARASWKRLGRKWWRTIVPCAPFELTQFTGDVGRKFPLKEIREKTLSQLLTDEEIDQLTDEELSPTSSRECLKQYQRLGGDDHRVWSCGLLHTDEDIPSQTNIQATATSW